MKDFTFRLAPLSLTIMGLICFSSIAIASADADNSSPTLEGARVTPENGPWESTFTYEVVYTDNENNMPALGYPKVYINGNSENMAEKDSTDNDVTDGKVYQYYWTTMRENVGLHSFYFYVETSTGENARNPENGNYEGPNVEKLSLSLSSEVDTSEVTAKKIVTFSGYLKTTDENLGVVGENIIIYKNLSNENIIAGSATTDENGYFTLTLEVSSSEIFCYRARFPGDNYYEASESSNLYVNTLDKPLAFGIYAVALLALVGGLTFLLSRGIARAHYLMPVVLGFFLGFFLVLIGAGFIGVLAAGGIAGYLFAKRTPEWTKHLRIGFMTGILFLILGLIDVYFVLWFPEIFSPTYSVTQTELLGALFIGTIISLINYALLVCVGAMLGGLLRKILKPREQKPPSGSEETTSSGVERQ